MLIAGGGGLVLPVLLSALFVVSKCIICTAVDIRHIWGYSEVFS